YVVRRHRRVHNTTHAPVLPPVAAVPRGRMPADPQAIRHSLLLNSPAARPPANYGSVLALPYGHPTRGSSARPPQQKDKHTPVLSKGDRFSALPLFEIVPPRCLPETQ